MTLDLRELIRRLRAGQPVPPENSIGQLSQDLHDCPSYPARVRNVCLGSGRYGCVNPEGVVHQRF